MLRAYITGGATGIGLAIATLITDQGGRVAMADKHADAVADALDANPTLRASVLDVTDDAALREDIHAAAEALGGLDCLVNNAGVVLPEPVDAVSTAALDACLAVNLRAPILATAAALPFLRRSANASICHLASEAAHTGYPHIAVYSATKGGLMALARAQAVELAAAGVRVNTVSPGLTETAMVHNFARLASPDPEAYLRGLRALQPTGRFNAPEEAAAAVVWLASEAARRVTGHDLRVDGGVTILGHFLGSHGG